MNIEFRAKLADFAAFWGAIIITCLKKVLHELLNEFQCDVVKWA